MKSVVESAPIEGWDWGGHRGRRSRVELLDFTLTERTTMTEDRLPLNELLRKAGDGDLWPRGDVMLTSR